MIECEQFVGRLREICRGEADLPLAKINAYRQRWNLDPLPAKTAAPPLPSLMLRVARFVPAIMRHALDGGRKRTENEVEELLAICEQCPLFRADVGKCAKCGCNCSRNADEFLNKLAWRSERCPEGKW